MPFDCTAMDAPTQFLLELRDRLTPENWRPYPVSNRRDFDAGRGCLIQQFHHVVRHRRPCPRDVVPAVHRRLLDAAGCKRFDDLARFNDGHTLDEVCTLVDRAIAG